MDFDRTFRPAIEGFYPDEGRGEAPLAARDATLVVRRDDLPRPGGAPVTVLTVVEGGRAVPGMEGDFPPCPARNCDIDGIAESLRFRRAWAGLRTSRNRGAVRARGGKGQRAAAANSVRVSARVAGRRPSSRSPSITASTRSALVRARAPSPCRRLFSKPTRT